MPNLPSEKDALPLSFYEQLRQITLDEREVTHAHPIINFLRCAIRWSFRPKFRQAGVVLTPLDVADMMNDFKEARLDNGYNFDGYLDLAGYASCAVRMDERLKALGHPEGIKIFDDAPSIQMMCDMLTAIEMEWKKK